MTKASLLVVACGVLFMWAGTATFMYWRSINKENHLASFIGWLLLDDKLEQHHKEGFKKWVRESSATNASDLGFAALMAIQGLAERLAEPSTLGFDALVWKYKESTQKEGD